MFNQQSTPSSVTLEFKDFQGPFQGLFQKKLFTFWHSSTSLVYMQPSLQNSQLYFAVSNEGKTRQCYRVTWQKVQINSLPLSNQNFLKPTDHIPGLFKTFKALKCSFEFTYIQGLSRMRKYPNQSTKWKVLLLKWCQKRIANISGIPLLRSV